MDASPAAPAAPAAPAVNPHAATAAQLAAAAAAHAEAAQRVLLLERSVLRLRREMDRMTRVMALLEHDRAVDRIVGTQPGILDRIGAWIGEWAAWFSPWSSRPRPRPQRPLA